MLTKAEIYDPEWMTGAHKGHRVKPGWHEAAECGRAGKYEAMPPVPAIQNIHTKVFEAAAAPDALDMAWWHTCETTHCRAGWVVHLAGDAGYDLESHFGPAAAALLIYRASDPEHPVTPARFYETTREALADMRACAEREAAR